MNELYIDKKNNLALLITGEGPFQSALCLSKAIGELQLLDFSIQKIINLGTAGALTTKLEMGEIIQGKISYHGIDSEHKKMGFKSYPLELFCEHTPTHDIITAEERVLEFAQKKYYSFFGDVVDRELWGQTQTAQLYKIPICSIKIISDEIHDENFCELVKEKAEKFSMDLLNYFLERNISLNSTLTPDISTLEKYLFNNPQLFFSVAQKNLLKKYAKKIHLTEDLEHSINEIIQHNVGKRGKEISKIILEIIEQSYSPVTYNLFEQSKEKILIHNTSEIQLRPDPIFENPCITFQGKMISEKDKQQIISVLEKIDLEDWKKTIEGDFLV